LNHIGLDKWAKMLYASSPAARKVDAMATPKQKTKARAGGNPVRFCPIVFTLTPRELEVLKLQARGFIYKEIAAKLHLSEHTVNNHLYSIRQKLHAHNTIEAINAASRLGFFRLN
jgi:DNA-binding NarL/FixJ family response regulator